MSRPLNRKVKALQTKALCRMDIEHKNALGTKELAKRYGFSKLDLNRIFYLPYVSRIANTYFFKLETFQRGTPSFYVSKNNYVSILI